MTPNGAAGTCLRDALRAAAGLGRSTSPRCYTEDPYPTFLNIDLQPQHPLT